ncbi:hypothetical protein [Pseudoduganella umbonata]|uniref:Uncharacterized protein n=1 Tax=Pseudoduganella umbonata TaxID=864828 RepID=A0A4P8HQK7_9BURK|nr:hypothetical protein [Pseudoduganella umbonata]MBB3222658.1 hypothetical protein [Pseudoduganella umbonata]QCP10838.1 hypothetical protein FCL38_10645 [Pseudoduganella umbonata]
MTYGATKFFAAKRIDGMILRSGAAAVLSALAACANEKEVMYEAKQLRPAKWDARRVRGFVDAVAQRPVLMDKSSFGRNLMHRSWT